MTTPAVYVGTYHQYNCGSIFGKWMRLTDFDGPEDFEEACRQLHKGEADPEFMFQDCEGIPSRFYSESSINWHFIEGYKQAVDAACQPAGKILAGRACRQPDAGACGAANPVACVKMPEYEASAGKFCCRCRRICPILPCAGRR